MQHNDLICFSMVGFPWVAPCLGKGGLPLTRISWIKHLLSKATSLREDPIPLPRWPQNPMSWGHNEKSAERIVASRRPKWTLSSWSLTIAWRNRGNIWRTMQWSACFWIFRPGKRISSNGSRMNGHPRGRSKFKQELKGSSQWFFNTWRTRNSSSRMGHTSWVALVFSSATRRNVITLKRNNLW